MAKEVPANAEPQGTIVVADEGAHLPQRFADNADQGLVVRTRRTTRDYQKWGGATRPFPGLTAEDFQGDFQGDLSDGYVKNPNIGRDQVALLLYGDEEPALFDVHIPPESVELPEFEEMLTEDDVAEAGVPDMATTRAAVNSAIEDARDAGVDAAKNMDPPSIGFSLTPRLDEGEYVELAERLEEDDERE